MDRFFEKTIPITESGCLIWIGADDGSYGYGKFKISGKTHYAHRLAWQMTNGLIPTGLSVLHKCDVPSCVNPNHLFLGTHKQNMADMVNKKRSPNNSQEHNPRSVLTREQVNEIRKKYEAGGFSQKTLGSIYGVSQVQIGNIVRYEQWSDKP